MADQQDQKGLNNSSDETKGSSENGNGSFNPNGPDFTVPNPNTRASDCNIYINSLPKEINDEKLTQMFCSFGDIESARVMLDFNTRISRGYGFVKFKTADSARNAVQTMDNFQLGTNTLTVKFANESQPPSQTASNNIFLKGLPVTVKADQLKQVCEKFGPVTDLRILADFSTGLSRGQALVRFESVESASACINEFSGQPFPVAGNVVPLTAKFAENDEEKADRKTKMKKRIAANRYLPYGHNAAAPGQPSQSPYGDYPPSPYYPPDPYAQYGAPGGYGGPGGYPQMNQMHPYPQYPSQPSQFNSGGFNSTGGYPPMGDSPSHGHSGPPGAYGDGSDPNVYVYHLPPETTDINIYQRFGKYGSVLSIKIARDPAGVCKGYGFIRYAAMDAAMRAISGENGQRVGNRTLSVSLAKQKGSNPMANPMSNPLSNSMLPPL